jgi:tetratricopeptide (TPR) repeat protein
MGVVRYDPPIGEGVFQIAQILRERADQISLERTQEKSISEAYELTRSHAAHEILGVEAGAPREAIESAYAEAKERFSRERLLPRVREKMRSELAIVESRLIESFLTLTQVRSREMGSREEDGGSSREVGVDDLLVRVEMDKTETRKEIDEHVRVADSHYAKAKKFMQERDYHNAIQYGKLAISYCPEDSRYYFLLGECQGKNPEARWQRMAEQNYLKAAELDPWNVEYPLALGRLYKRRGLKLRARKQFERALELAPSHAAASQELSSLA